MSTTASDQPASHDKRTLTVALVLGILGLIGIAAIIFWVWRMKKPADDILPTSSESSAKAPYAFTGFGNKYQGVKVEDTGHPAARITPFAFLPNGDGPVFHHEPGQNMRIASRRPNGVWTFHDVDPATGSPIGVDDPSPSPSSPYSTSTSGTPAFFWEPRGYSSLRTGDSSAVRTGSSGRKRSVGNYLEYLEQTSPSAPSATYGSATVPSLPPGTPSSYRQPQRHHTADL